MTKPRASAARAFPSRFRSPDRSPGFLLWRVSLAWQRGQRAALAPLGLTHVQAVLLLSAWWLSEQGEVVTQARLAAHAGADTMMTSQVLRALATKRLLERHDHPQDARAWVVSLTAAGRSRARQALAAIESADAALFATLGPRSRTLATLLRDLDHPPRRSTAAHRRAMPSRR